MVSQSVLEEAQPVCTSILVLCPLELGDKEHILQTLGPIWVDSLLWPQDTQAQKKLALLSAAHGWGWGLGHGVQGYLWDIQDSQRTGASWNVGTCLVVMTTGISWVRLRCCPPYRMWDRYASPDGPPSCAAGESHPVLPHVWALNTLEPGAPP